MGRDFGEIPIAQAETDYCDNTDQGPLPGSDWCFRRLFSCCSPQGNNEATNPGQPQGLHHQVFAHNQIPTQRQEITTACYPEPWGLLSGRREEELIVVGIHRLFAGEEGPYGTSQRSH